MNQAPVVTAPISINVDEDVSTAVTGISFADADAGSSAVTVTLSVASGSMTAVSGAGVVVGGTSSSLTLTGSIADINAFIAASGVSYQTALNSTSNVVLTVDINDGGNTGSGGAQTDSDTVTLVVTAVNDAPVNTVPAAQTLDQDTALVFSSGNGNLISISDVDAGGGTVRVTLTGSNGLITLSGTTGLSFIVGSGANDGSMTFEGTLADINAALNGMIFSPTPGYHGAASLQIVSSDLGLSGSGGNQTDSDTIAITVASINPEVTSVNVTNPDGAYKVGDTVTVTVTFDQAVTVNTSGGTPSLVLETGTTDRHATYVSGSGSNTLTFSYTVQAGDLSADLDYQSTGALPLNGATIRSATNDDALLTLPATGGTGSIAGQHDIVIDGVAPTVTSVSVPPDGTYVAGQNLDFTVNLSEAVTVDTSGGTPRLAVSLDVGGVVHATYLSGSGTSALVFRLTVSGGQQDANGISIGGSMELNGGTLRDAAGNDAVPTLNGVGATTGVLVDTAAPTVTSVSVPPDGTYVAGQNLDFTVNLSEAVTVDTSGGTPRLAVSLDVGGVVHATYLSGSGTSALVFRLTLSGGQLDTNGISIGGSIELNGGTLRDAAGNDAVTTLNGVGATTGVLVDTAPTNITGTLEVDEAAANGSIVGTLSALGGSSYTFSLVSGDGDDDNSNFSIDSAGNVSVANGLLLDYEQKATFTIRVRAEDAGGLGLEKVLTGTIRDVNPEIVFGDGDANVVVGGPLNDELSGGDGHDGLYGGDGDDLLRGGIGDDILRGGTEADRLYGGAGADTLFGGNGDDLLRGGTGDDLLRGGTEADRLYGGAGADTLFGGEGDDLLRGGQGDDLLRGGNGDDILRGGTEADRLYGGAGADTLFGGQGDDLLHGGIGDDILRGGTEADRLYGGAGADTLFGGEGDDLLRGGTEADRLYGGAGADTLVGEEGSDLLFGGDGIDVALFSGNLANYSFVAAAGGGIIVTDNVGTGGSDILYQMEFATFADQTVGLDTLLL